MIELRRTIRPVQSGELIEDLGLPNFENASAQQMPEKALYIETGGPNSFLPEMVIYQNIYRERSKQSSKPMLGENFKLLKKH